ncbi:serine/threonine-protein kinase mos-like [Littorina saxatilis]|uniref:serine/threonine-protein kinase mos-like n=1 Tax=Littorina saxatilis TaxID=31220 RepID=UPI0038B69A0A
MATSSSWRIEIPESSTDLGQLASPTCLPAAAAATTSLKSSRERLPQSLDLDCNDSVGASLGDFSCAEDGRSATTSFLDTSASSAFVFPPSPDCELPPRPECDGLSATTDGLLAVCEASAQSPVSPSPFLRETVNSTNIEHVRCDTVYTPSPVNAASPPSPASPERAEHSPVSPVPSNPSSLSDKLIRPEEIRPDKLLGRGGFGTVSLGFYKERMVVCKNFHSHIDDEVARETYERELKALELDLDHENVVAVLGASSLQGWQPGACVVMSYAGSVTLDSYLSDPRNQMTVQHVLFFTSHVMEGLSYLHSRGVLHLDLKPANCVFCPEEQTLRLCDLGALHVVGESWGSRVEGTVAFRAPELFSSHTPAPSFPCDVYSLAVTMWCLDSRQFPFESYPRECIIYNVVQNNLRPPVPETAVDSQRNSFLQQYRDLYTACWSAEPSLRPTLDDVMDVIYDIAEQL